MRGLLVALAGLAGLALYVTHRHYAERDAEAAAIALMTWRFDGTTRSRLNDWLQRSGVRSSTVAEPPGPFSRTVRVNLRIEQRDHWFMVDVGARRPTPLGAASAALVERVRAAAKK